jgi:8-amino-7-oxononanoate synthase
MSLRKLSDRKQYRSLKLPNGGIDFCSNDYLGLARSEALYVGISEAMRGITTKRNGSTGSRLLSGNSSLIEDLERKLAARFHRESSLLFDSGYMANLAVLSTLPQRSDTIIMDELSHASLKDGARLSLAAKWNFRHNNIDDLRKKLQMAKGNKWIVVESIYSMDGDRCLLKEVVELAKHLGAYVILDEAHTTGLAEQKDVPDDVDIRICTFGKAMGVHGACVCTNNNIRNLLINFSRPFIYTTAPSDHSVVSISCAFDFLDANLHLQGQLNSRVTYFNRNLNGSGTQIQVVIVPGHERVTQAARQLQEAGFDIRPILSPTVKEGEERLRICLHVFNTDDEIDQLASTMKRLSLI